MNTITF